MQRRFPQPAQISFLNKQSQLLDDFLRYIILRPIQRLWLMGGGYFQVGKWRMRVLTGMRPKSFIWPFAAEKTDNKIQALHRGKTAYDEAKGRKERAIIRQLKKRQKRELLNILSSLIHHHTHGKLPPKAANESSTQ